MTEDAPIPAWQEELAVDPECSRLRKEIDRQAQELLKITPNFNMAPHPTQPAVLATLAEWLFDEPGALFEGRRVEFERAVLTTYLEILTNAANELRKQAAQHVLLQGVNTQLPPMNGLRLQ